MIKAIRETPATTLFSQLPAVLSRVLLETRQIILFLVASLLAQEIVFCRTNKDCRKPGYVAEATNEPTYFQKALMTRVVSVRGAQTIVRAHSNSTRRLYNTRWDSFVAYCNTKQ